MISLLKDDCWFFLKGIYRKIFDVLSHKLGCSRFRASLSYFAICCCSSISYHSLSSACIFFQVLFENLILLVLWCLFNFRFYRFRNKIWKLHSLFLFFCLLFRCHKSTSQVLRSFGLNLLKLFFCKSLLLFDFLISFLDNILVFRKSLLPSWLDEAGESSFLLLFRKESYVSSKE